MKVWPLDLSPASTHTDPYSSWHWLVIVVLFWWMDLRSAWSFTH